MKAIHTKRIVDIGLAFILLILLLVPLILIAITISFLTEGPVIYWSYRVGRNNKLFQMPKFCSMKPNAPLVATHLLKEPSTYITPIGNFLRKTSLDELPQLWSILIGDMSFVGPRPALFNQDDLISLRTSYGVSQIYPGVTGWAQINGRDELTIAQKVQLEVFYLKNQSLSLDLYIIYLTVIKVFKRSEISH